MYDVIVIGARCAGSPTAMLLARKGYRVLLVDRSQFPSDTLSTHVVKSPAGAQLARWGLLDQVVASNCPPMLSITLDLGPFSLAGSAPPADGVAAQYSPRRTILDKILVDAAVEAGAELRQGFSVDDILFEDDGVTGIRGGARGGRKVTEKATIVIGADGINSRLARAVDAPLYHAKPALTCAYYTYWSGVPIDAAELCPRLHRSVIAFPTNDGLVCIIVQWPHHEFAAFRRDVEGNYLQTLELVPGLAERVRNGKREERFHGTDRLPNFFRKPYGPGWALVGDAGCHKDPITAQGITDAFRDAGLLADAIDHGLDGRRGLEDALADYEQRRNQAALPIYELTCEFAALDPPPATMQLLAALRGNQEQINRFHGTHIGTVPIPEFFSPENLARIGRPKAGAEVH